MGWPSLEIGLRAWNATRCLKPDRCKTHAVGCAVAAVRLGRAAIGIWRALEHRVRQQRASLAQGKPWPRVLSWITAAWTLCLAASPAQAVICPGPRLSFEPLGAGVWRVPGQTGDADPFNRGQVVHLLLVRDSRRLWALGSGPSPAFGRALACQARQRLGQAISDVVSPWARPEAVLGVAGLGPVRHWAHASVAAAMAEQCPRCVARLRLRLQAAAVDLGPKPIRLPAHRLSGAQGRLGPFDWWRLPRAEGRWLTVWRLHDRPLWAAPGLLAGDGPPDGRDADLALMQRSAARLAVLAAADGDAARFVAEQGALRDAEAPARDAAYWQALLDAARVAIERGDDEAAPAPALPGWPADWAGHPWHGFNWQRAWRQVEPQVLGSPSAR